MRDIEAQANAEGQEFPAAAAMTLSESAPSNKTEIPQDAINATSVKQPAPSAPIAAPQGKSITGELATALLPVTEPAGAAPTPRTDFVLKAAEVICGKQSEGFIALTRQLERELAAAKAERDAWKEVCEVAWSDLDAVLDAARRKA